jgi:amino-acid N-acetyltransferase
MSKVLPPDLTIELSAFNDHDRIRVLLKEASLPLPDWQDHPVRFLVARTGRTIAGCLGWEDYEQYALLRSLTVHQDFRRRGIATALLQSAMERLEKEGKQQLFLLTDLPELGTSCGFVECGKDMIPHSVQASQQLASSMCSKAKCMCLTLRDQG